MCTRYHHQQGLPQRKATAPATTAAVAAASSTLEREGKHAVILEGVLAHAGIVWAGMVLDIGDAAVRT